MIWISAIKEDLDMMLLVQHKIILQIGKLLGIKLVRGKSANRPPEQFDVRAHPERMNQVWAQWKANLSFSVVRCIFGSPIEPTIC